MVDSSFLCLDITNVSQHPANQYHYLCPCAWDISDRNRRRWRSLCLWTGNVRHFMFTARRWPTFWTSNQKEELCSGKKGARTDQDTQRHPSSIHHHMDLQSAPGESNCHLPSVPLISCNANMKWILESIVSSVAAPGVWSITALYSYTSVQLQNSHETKQKKYWLDSEKAIKRWNWEWTRYIFYLKIHCIAKTFTTW